MRRDACHSRILPGFVVKSVSSRSGPTNGYGDLPVQELPENHYLSGDQSFFNFGLYSKHYCARPYEVNAFITGGASPIHPGFRTPLEDSVNMDTGSALVVFVCDSSRSTFPILMYCRCRQLVTFRATRMARVGPLQNLARDHHVCRVPACIVCRHVLCYRFVSTDLNYRFELFDCSYFDYVRLLRFVPRCSMLRPP